MTRPRAAGQRGERRRSPIRVWLLLGGIGAAACGPAPWADASPSADNLARAVLEAVARHDAAALAALALSEDEFRVQVWPSLPAARPERNLPADYVWADLQQKSRASLSSTLAAHGGRRYALVKVQTDGPPADYGRFRVHRRSAFVLHDESGDTIELRLAGSLIEQSGRWKVFSYVVGD